MKNFLYIIIVLIFISCSKSESNCSTCHIVVYQESNAYYLSSLEEFCNEELTSAQNNEFFVSDTVFSDYLNNQLPSPINPEDTLYYHCGDSHSH